MTVKIRFFARFRELLGTDIVIEFPKDTVLSELLRDITRKKSRDGYDAIFDANGSFREFVILMRNGRRLEHAEAEQTMVADGDEVAIFPPVAGG